MSIDKNDPGDVLVHSKTAEIQAIRSKSNPGGGMFQFGKGGNRHVADTQ